GKVFGEFGDLNLAPERRNEKWNSDKKELHGVKGGYKYVRRVERVLGMFCSSLFSSNSRVTKP
ncbi:hypothetical protein N8536_03835, partial [Akkermansiaceae bacterium]|nr:hypothetical protein [Akkermansiaceae bacterium]